MEELPLSHIQERKPIMAENNPNLPHQDEGTSLRTIVLWICGVSLVLGFLVWGLTSYWNKTTPTPKALSNITALAELKALVAEMGTNQAKYSSELAELVKSNQVVVSEMVTTIRAEIPGLVEKEVARAMDPFQRLLALTNSAPPPTPVVAPAKPPVVMINNSNMVTTQAVERVESFPTVVINNQNWMGSSSSGPPPPPPPQPQPQKGAKPPYWLRDLQ